ncbi:MAG: hypothetical protein Faunusvirus39_7 [Faunusvirus sp.]|uniref:Uncharacterized protein n=1 Tax=Faunusvirus sp. TaxID=2487766 RepID=A0A3G4ZXR9_9VIRU|nr:MAG: hypothetical protein Faunusvirus39_7 [Faunusvirus sp.]
MTDVLAIILQLNYYIQRDHVKPALALINSYKNIFCPGYKTDSTINNDELAPINPLLLSCYHDRPDISIALIDRGVYLNIQYSDFYNRSPLYYACQNNRANVVTALIKNGANIHIVDADDVTPLYAACCYKNDIIAMLLIDSGADINFKTIHGNSAFDMACVQKMYRSITYMLMHGADSNISLDDGVKQHIFNEYKSQILATINNTADNPMKLSFRTTYAIDIIDLICDFIL